MGNTIRRRRAFGYGAITLCGPAFNPVRLTRRFITPAGPARTRTHAPSTPRAQRLAPVTRARFGLIRFRSPLLTEHPFLQVLRCFTSLRPPRANAVPAHDGRRVPPFGNPRIKALLAAPRGISQPQTSFIGTVCQGIHHTPLQATRTTHPGTAGNRKPTAKTPLATQIITQMITHKTIKHQTPKSPAKSTAEDTPERASPARVHYPVLKPPRTRTRAHPPHQGTGDRHGARNTSHAKRRGVAVREPKSMPAPLLDAPHDRHARRPTPLFHTSNPHTPGTSGARGHTPATRQWPEISVERR